MYALPGGEAKRNFSLIWLGRVKPGDGRGDDGGDLAGAFPWRHGLRVHGYATRYESAFCS